MRTICVFLSSSAGREEDVAAISALGAELARRELGLVYGGATRGLMGVLANATLAAGGRVVGVIPTTLVDREMAHAGLHEQHVVETMHQRKHKMFELADGFVVAPGGFGTLEEAFEILTGIQIEVHRKPVVFLDTLGFWQPMAAFLDHAVAARVLLPDMRALFRTAPTPAAALDEIARLGAW